MASNESTDGEKSTGPQQVPATRVPSGMRVGENNKAKMVTTIDINGGKKEEMYEKNAQTIGS